MVKKVKKYPHAFFERNTWNHRTKKLLPDYTIKYGKKGGFETAEEAEKAYQEHIKEFDRKMNMTFLEVDKEVTLKNFLLYWYVSIFSERVQSTTRYLVSYVLYGMLLPNIDEKIKLKFVSTDYLNELLDKVAKYCKSAGFKSRETLYIAMKDAQFLRLIDNNPVKATKTYPRPKRKITVLNKSQTRCFLTAAKERNWFLEIILGLYCGLRKGDDDDKIRLNQRKPSKYKGLSRFGPEKNLQRINKFMKERPIFYKNLIQMKENFRFYLRCFYCITKVVILQFNSENRTELARNG